MRVFYYKISRHQWHIFHILTSEDIANVIDRFLHWIYIIIRYEVYILVMKTIFYSLITLIRKILFTSFEDKIHIFAPPCNIPYTLFTKLEVRTGKMSPEVVTAVGPYSQEPRSIHAAKTEGNIFQVRISNLVNNLFIYFFLCLFIFSRFLNVLAFFRVVLACEIRTLKLRYILCTCT